VTLTQQPVTSQLTVASMLLRTVERHPEHEALIHHDRRWSYEAWNARVNRAAHALAGLGIRPFDRVAILLRAGEASVTLYFAAQKLGAVAVPMNFRLAPREVAHVLRDSGARLVAYGAELTETVSRVAAEVNGIGALIAVDAEGKAHDGHLEYETLLAQASDHEPVITSEIDPQMLAAVVYTSGTTGMPKGVMHTHANDVTIAMNCALEYQLGPGDRALHIAPLYHVGGMQAFFVPHMLVGATNIIQSKWDAAHTLQTIEQEQVSTLFAVPQQIQAMLHQPQFSTFDISSLTMITTGGATLPAATMERVLAEVSPRLYNGYGMTEASLTLLMNPRDALRKLGSCGKSTLLSETRIVVNDPVRDVLPEEQVLDGDVGQLIVRGPHTTPGYWNRPSETAQRLRHGWLYTGDLFFRDAEGYHYFQGRADDLIVSGGENIYPSEVEDVLHRCPGVREAVVVGVADPNWGSAVTAFVVRDDPALTEGQVDDFFRDGGLLAAFKRPRRVIFVDALPTNASGKVLTRELLASHDRNDTI
jgi:acyl-CoA synthetase (AMP-forming)/AMP-acid ligase II